MNRAPVKALSTLRTSKGIHIATGKIVDIEAGNYLMQKAMIDKYHVWRIGRHEPVWLVTVDTLEELRRQAKAIIKV